MAEEVKKTSGRPKKVVEDKDVVAVDKEKEELKAKNDEMAEMLKQMQEQMKTMQAQMNVQNQTQPNIILEQNYYKQINYPKNYWKSKWPHLYTVFILQF